MLTLSPTGELPATSCSIWPTSSPCSYRGLPATFYSIPPPVPPSLLGSTAGQAVRKDPSGVQATNEATSKASQQFFHNKIHCENFLLLTLQYNLAKAFVYVTGAGIASL
jgi:hypothetical protein